MEDVGDFGDPWNEVDEEADAEMEEDLHVIADILEEQNREGHEVREDERRRRDMRRQEEWARLETKKLLAYVLQFKVLFLGYFPVSNERTFNSKIGVAVEVNGVLWARYREDLEARDVMEFW